MIRNSPFASCSSSSSASSSTGSSSYTGRGSKSSSRRRRLSRNKSKSDFELGAQKIEQVKLFAHFLDEAKVFYDEPLPVRSSTIGCKKNLWPIGKLNAGQLDLNKIPSVLS